MIKKDHLVWIMYLLLMEHALSEDACEQGTCLGQLSFGEFLPLSAFTTKYQVSLYQCATECQLRIQRCKSFNYRRSALSCQLCEEDSGPGGTNLLPKDGSIHSNINTWKNIPIKHCSTINCSWTERCDPSKPVGGNDCVPTECAFTELKLGMTIEPSNETAVRTKVRRRCMSQNMERGEPITTCLESEAKWSNPDFKCVCITHPARTGTIQSTTKVEVGEHYTYRCSDGLVSKAGQDSKVTCLPDGSWTSTNFTCVCTNPPARSGTINCTTEAEIGQNDTYECQAGLVAKAGQNPTVTCLQNGSWTSTNFTCVCKTPPTKSGVILEMTEVEVRQNYTYKCQDGLFEKGDLNPTITCLQNGSWTSRTFLCVKQNWKQDTIYPNNIHRSELIRNLTGIALLECMQQCDDTPNNCFSFFYDNHTRHCMLSSSFQRGLPQGFISLDGMFYYTAPSTLCDMEYTNVSLGGSYFCIKCHDVAAKFNDAMKSCESEKAKLLVITTQAEITDLKNFVARFNDWIFIGVSDEVMEGKWVSWNGDEVKLFWNDNEPNSRRGEEDCVAIHFSANGVFDLNCNAKERYVCHKNNF